MKEHRDGFGHPCQCPIDEDHDHCVGRDTLIDQGEVFLHRLYLEDDARIQRDASDRDRAIARARTAGGFARPLGAGLYAVKTGGREHRTSLDPRSCDCEAHGRIWCLHMGAVWLVQQREAVNA